MEHPLTLPEESGHDTSTYSHEGLAWHGSENPTVSPAARSTAGLNVENIAKLTFHTPPLTMLSLTGHGKQSIARRCELYDRFGQFLPAPSVSIYTGAIAEQVQRTVQEMEMIMVEADRLIRTKADHLDHQIIQFRDSLITSIGPHWYSGFGDLTDCDFEAFEDIVRRMQTPDLRHFTAYLIGTLPKAAQTPRRDDEYGETTFVTKVHLLLAKVLRESVFDYSVAFKFFIAVQTQVLLGKYARIPHRSAKDEHMYIDHSLLWMMERYSESANPDTFWDFPTTWRQLVHTWQDNTTRLEDLLKVLGSLRIKAEVEVRRRVRLSLSGRLPEDLFETLFEWTMLAEDIPLERDA